MSIIDLKKLTTYLGGSVFGFSTVLTASASRGAAEPVQNIPSPSAIRVEFNVEIEDVGGWFDPAVSKTQMVVPAGVTRVLAMTTVIGGNLLVGGDICRIDIRRNGSNTGPGVPHLQFPVTALFNPFWNVSGGPFPVDPGDVIEVFAGYIGAGTMDIQTDTRTMFSVWSLV